MRDLDDLVSKYGRYLKSLAMDFVVVVVGASYVFYQMITLEPTDLNPIVLLAQAIMGIICGIIIKQALGENGFSKGYNSPIWVEEEDLYNNACNGAVKYMERVDNFYACEEIEKRKNYRRQHLQEYRMKYDMWFDSEGNYIGTQDMYEKLDKKQKRMLDKCIKVKIFNLNLFSQYLNSVDNDTKPEITDKRQKAKNLTKNTISAIVIAIIGVYFIPMINKWNWASFISSTMQVSLWILFGVLQLYTNYNFVVQDKVALLKKKKELIKKFISGCDNGNYLTSPYEIVDISITNSIIDNDKSE